MTSLAQPVVDCVPLPAADTPALADPVDVGVLDSSTAFEGPEKLLEIWFAPGDTHVTNDSKVGLKAVPEEKWHEMLDLVSCKVLSVIRSVQLDAYLLSESSMFVYPYRIILKTCGTTTLLHGLWRILELAAEYAQLPCELARISETDAPVAVPHRVFYSRKSYLFPHQQLAPHRSWEEEVAFLKKVLFGHAITVGDTTDDPWYLFYTKPSTEKFPLVGFPQSSLPSSKAPSVISFPTIQDLEDETIEILMTDLHIDQASLFYEPSAEDDRGLVVPASGNEIEVAHELGAQVSAKCGLSSVYPLAKFPAASLDSYLFSPCGFSANGVVPVPASNGQPAKTYYWTVHVTPQECCSYASFETNVPVGLSGHTIDGLVKEVVKIFGAGRFTVNRFEPPEPVSAAGSRKSTRNSSTATLPEPIVTPKGLKRFFKYPIRRLWSRAGTRTPSPPRVQSPAESVMRSHATPRVEGYSLTTGSFHFLPDYHLIFGTYARLPLTA